VKKVHTNISPVIFRWFIPVVCAIIGITNDIRQCKSKENNDYCVVEVR
jgi:hypothetical protein